MKKHLTIGVQEGEEHVIARYGEKDGLFVVVRKDGDGFSVEVTQPATPTEVATIKEFPEGTKPFIFLSECSDGSPIVVSRLFVSAGQLAALSAVIPIFTRSKLGMNGGVTAHSDLGLGYDDVDGLIDRAISCDSVEGAIKVLTDEASKGEAGTAAAKAVREIVAGILAEKHGETEAKRVVDLAL